MDDDSFKARVQKVFGSLSASQTPWSLADGEVEKREWGRERAGSGRDDDVTPCASSFNGLFTRDRNSSRFNRRKLEDGTEEDCNDDEDGDDEKSGSGGIDEWDLRSSIGLDSTLDNEEEEDAYDKLAEGRENAGERLYMRDVTDHGPYLNAHNVLPTSLREASRDPRADLSAAKDRLKKDEEETQMFSSNPDRDQPMIDVVEPHVNASEVGHNKPKPILKRKAEVETSKKEKRVRFDPACKNNDQESLVDEDPEVSIRSTDQRRISLRVPDYLLNPSRYTHYTFDSVNDDNDESNNQAHSDFLELEKASNPEEYSSQSGDKSPGLPKSVTFIPRKKASSTTPMDSDIEVKQNEEDSSKLQSANQTGAPISIADEEALEAGVLEDENETNDAGTTRDLKKPCRRYRSRPELDESVC